MSSLSGITSIMNSGSVNQMSTDLIKKGDTNGDKVLTANEAGAVQDVFSKNDTNSDGPEGKNELNMAYHVSQIDQMTIGFISGNDRDGDSALSIDELGLPKDIFSSIDTNNDGLASKDELNAAYYARQLDQLTNGLLGSKDTNSDSVLSIDELGLSQDIFSTIDTNKDDQASKDELNAAHPLTQYSNAIMAFQVDFINNTSSMIDITS